MSTDELVVERDGEVAVVTLNRPERRNALTESLMACLWSTMEELESAEHVAAIILTGTDPAFCAGLDLKELSTTGANVHSTVVEWPWPKMSKIVIGAVNGAAVTGGLELALNCDFLIASQLATFADTHSRVGVLPGWGLTVQLPQAVGLRRAKEMSATGNYVNAELAFNWGLVNRVVPHSDLLALSMEIAHDIASNDLVTFSALLALYEENAAGTAAEGLAREWSISRKWRDTVFLPEDVAKRTESVQMRGRSQVH
jgi:enoyl-CoA hydratase